MASQGSMSGARVQGGEKLSAAEEDQFRDYSTNLNPSKPMGLERMHVMVLRELADDTGRLGFVVAWRLAKVLNNRKKENITLVFKKWQDDKPGCYRLVSLSLAPGKIME